jgi:hypothetical protein
MRERSFAPDDLIDNFGNQAKDAQLAGDNRLGANPHRWAPRLGLLIRRNTSRVVLTAGGFTLKFAPGTEGSKGKSVRGSPLELVSTLQRTSLSRSMVRSGWMAADDASGGAADRGGTALKSACAR